MISSCLFSIYIDGGMIQLKARVSGEGSVLDRNDKLWDNVTCDCMRRQCGRVYREEADTAHCAKCRRCCDVYREGAGTVYSVMSSDKVCCKQQVHADQDWHH